MKIDVVIQGPSDDVTLALVEQCLHVPFVNNIILSSYKSEVTEQLKDWITVIENDTVNPPGVGNRNLQINTTRNGLNKVTSKYCVRLRSDQIVTGIAFNSMYNYWVKHEDPFNRISKSGSPLGRIYVLSLATKFVYHPRDHILWGFTDDLRKFFDCPFDTFVDKTNSNVTDPYSEVYSNHPQAEMWMGMHYYANYDESALLHKNNFTKYVTNLAPLKADAFETEKKNLDRLFKSFPLIPGILWPKHGFQEYPYHLVADFGEYWAND